MIRTALLIFCITIISYSGLANNNKIKSNFEILDSLVSGYVEFLYENFIYEQKDTIKIIISKHSAEWLFKKHLTEKRGNRTLIISNDSEFNKSSVKIDIWINKLKVNLSYDNKESGTIIRIAEIEVSTGITKPEGEIVSLPFYRNSIYNTLFEIEADLLKNEQYDFARAELPESDKTFFRKIIEPAIVISAAAITVLLLFTVRSK